MSQLRTLGTADRLASVPFVGHIDALPPPPAPARSFDEAGGLLLVLVGTFAMAWLLSFLPGADPLGDDGEDGNAILLEGGWTGAGLDQGVGLADAPPGPAPELKRSAIPEGPAQDVVPVHTAPESTGVPLASRRPTAAVVVRKTAVPRSFHIGEQIPGRPAAPQGTVGGAGAGDQGNSNQRRRPVSGSGGIADAIGAGGRRARVPGGEGPGGEGQGGEGQGGESGSRSGPVRAAVSVAELWAAVRSARPGGGGGISDAGLVAGYSRTIQDNPVLDRDGRSRSGWLIHTSGGQTCAIAESDRTVVCARKDASGKWGAYVAGPRAASYSTAAAAFELLARLAR